MSSFYERMAAAEKATDAEILDKKASEAARSADYFDSVGNRKLSKYWHNEYEKHEKAAREARAKTSALTQDSRQKLETKVGGRENVAANFATQGYDPSPKKFVPLTGAALEENKRKIAEHNAKIAAQAQTPAAKAAYAAARKAEASMPSSRRENAAANFATQGRDGLQAAHPVAAAAAAGGGSSDKIVGHDPKYGAIMTGKKGGKYVMHNGKKYYV